MKIKSIGVICCFFLSHLAWANQPLDWYLKETNTKFANSRDSVQFHPQKGFFILDYRGGRVLHYDLNGERLWQIGGKKAEIGHIRLMNDRLFLLKHKKVDVYNLSGKPIQLIRSPEGSMNLMKLGTGWVYFRNKLSLEKEIPLDVVLYDEAFKKQRTLVSFGTTTERGGKPHPVPNQWGELPRIFNPVMSGSKYGTDSSGRFIIVHPSYTRHVYIYDSVDKKKEPVVVSVSGESLPFPRKYGERLLKIEQDRAVSRGEEKYKADFPEFFPLINTVEILRDDHILINQYPEGLEDEVDLEDPATKRRIAQKILETTLIFDLNGNQQAYKPEYEFDYRIVGFAGDWVYLTVWNGEAGESTVTRQPKDDFMDFLKKSSAYKRD